MMSWVRRVALFLAINFLVMLVVGVLLNLLHADRWLTPVGLNVPALALFCFLYGMTGAVVSLLLSRATVKWLMRLKVVDPQHCSMEERELLAMVRALAQRAGLPCCPEVAIYESAELNAFATGPSKSRALVAVSRGLLSQMPQEHLKAILGHEITHIANGDMVTMTLLQGIVNALVLFLSRILAYGVVTLLRNRDVRAGNGMFWMVSLLLQILLMIPGMLVIAAYSRWREYRADRGGASLTSKDAMIGALKSLERNVGIQDPRGQVESVAAMKIADSGPRGMSFSQLYHSHPPLAKRIAALEAATR